MILTVPDRSKKISDSIVHQIRDAVMSGQYKLGDKIGSEKDLISQLNVSKATLREALRVLEAMGIVQIRKGLSGGVFVAEVGMKTTLDSILNFLSFQGVSNRDITLVRYIVEPAILQVAMPLITPEDLQKLAEIVSSDLGPGKEAPVKGISFHRYLAIVTQNPILMLVMDLIDNLVGTIKATERLGADFYAEIAVYHSQAFECIRAQDLPGAVAALRGDILFVDRYLAGLRGEAGEKTLAPGGDWPDMAQWPPPAGEVEPPEAARTAPPASAAMMTLPAGKMLLRQVGSGKLYLFEGVEGEESQGPAD